jgi:5'-3' exonuclease|tara:strand:+ start:998 stop:2014 length:1017 start_codon:yes stop_codon:yes gene_type:complete
VKRTLLVDGNSLLKTGFHGIKNMYNGENHIGGLFHFLKTLAFHIETNLITKTVVFWDGKNNASFRREIYPEYKENRRNSNKPKEEIESFYRQKLRVQEYLEELYVRQGEFEMCEADDMIAEYCNLTKEETIILTLDRDLLQLISENVSVYIMSINKLFKKGDLVPLNGCFIIPENVRLVKAVCGDSSDNIHGISLVGVKSLLNIIPEIKDKEVDLNYVIENISNKEKLNKRETNIINGVTKKGTLGLPVLEKNLEIIKMGKEFLTDEATEGVLGLSKESLDPEGRDWKNALNLMMSDGILNILPKESDSWVDFIKPFLRLSRIEKDFYKKNKTKNNEI